MGRASGFRASVRGGLGGAPGPYLRAFALWEAGSGVRPAFGAEPSAREVLIRWCGVPGVECDSCG